MSSLPRARRLALLIVTIATLLLTTGPRPGAVQTAQADLGIEIDTYMTRLSKFGFSGSILVARDGRVVLEKGYGLANRARGTPFTADTVSTIGSITKQFTAAAILKLEMQGKLHVEDQIGKYLPGVPPDKSGITIHHLLTHSAGFRGDFGGRDSDPIGRDDLVKLVLAAPLVNPPGKVYEYSNEGYSLLGAIVEIVSGQTYERYLQDNLFKPAGMTSTGYVLATRSPERVAHGYRDGQDWGTLEDKGWGPEGPGWYLKANGGIESTVSDMYKWHVALEGERILSKDAKAKYFAPHIPEGPRAQSFYGYGWTIVTTPRKTRLIAHNGGNGVFAADFRRYVDEGVVIIAMSNAEVSAIDVTSVIPALVFGGGEVTMPPAVVSLDASALARFAGSYRLPSGDTIEVRADNGGLRIASRAPQIFALLNGLTPPGDARFAQAEDGTRSTLEAGARGDFKTAHQPLAGQVPFERFAANDKARWDARRQRYGAFKAVEILGTSRGEAGPSVFARLVFERGSEFVRYIWDGPTLAGLQGLDAPPERAFLPTSATEFAAFTLRPPSLLRVRFSAAADTLTLGGPGREIVASREQVP
jgi:CubicO group peptidase (beta-lactamase class C family)